MGSCEYSIQFCTLHICLFMWDQEGILQRAFCVYLHLIVCSCVIKWTFDPKIIRCSFSSLELLMWDQVDILLRVLHLSIGSCGIKFVLSKKHFMCICNLPSSHVGSRRHSKKKLPVYICNYLHKRPYQTSHEYSYCRRYKYLVIFAY